MQHWPCRRVHGAAVVKLADWGGSTCCTGGTTDGGGSGSVYKGRNRWPAQQLGNGCRGYVQLQDQSGGDNEGPGLERL